MKILQRTLHTLLLLTAAASAVADDNYNYGPYSQKYTAECASCHVAYPPQKLTKAGWNTQMSHLEQHYGTNAALDDATHKEILAYLLSKASNNAKDAPTEASARLTKTRWFIKEHGTNPPRDSSFSNCSACHTQADKGDYSERNLRTPANWNHDEEDDD